ncbi:preprotein translocase, SecA subunit [Alicyclobacillus hesperidum URH17-3-68]|nr:preprotein translocase, SecA subunit [Alicyclobacillus hesperidum URH17-3-68]
MDGIDIGWSNPKPPAKPTMQMVHADSLYQTRDEFLLFFR